MPLKPKDVKKSPEKRRVTFDDTPFFEGILNDEYILVIGSGVILDKKKYPETNGDINTFLLNAINEEKNQNSKHFPKPFQHFLCKYHHCTHY